MRRFVPLLLAALALPAGAAALTHDEPRGVRCDGVEGVWQTRDDQPGNAGLMTVRLWRQRGALVGDARTESWLGAAGSAPPVGCVPGTPHLVLEAPMVATLAGGTLHWSIKPGALTTVSDPCGSSRREHMNGRSDGPVDLVAGIFDALFTYDAGSRRMTWHHVSCTR